MKKTLLYLVLTGIIFSFSSTLFSQTGSRSKILYDKNTGWYLGLNGGATYQSQLRGEVDRYAGFAGGFTFGKDWLKKDRFLGWGLRYRFLAGTTYGLDQNTTDSAFFADNDRFNGNSGQNLNYKDSVGYILHNYRTSLIDQSLELSIHLNRLRQRTGIIVSGFGGIGLTVFEAKTNQLDEFGNKYNHDVNAEYGVDDLRARPNLTLDNSFETDAAWNDGTDIDWMPTLGLELGFQLSPHAALTFVHRHTWTRRNSFDGQIFNRMGENTNVNDTYYYTGLSLKWNIHRGRGSHIDPIPTPDNNTSSLVVTPKKKPIVNITDPYANPHTVNSFNFNLKAKIYNVDGAHQITFKQNGVDNLNFTYYPASNGFSSNVVLKPGQNVFEIRATNEAGSDYESRVIIYADPVNTLPPPIVSIKNPSSCPFVVNSQSFTVSANIFNVDAKSKVKFRVNGQFTNNFSFNPGSNQFTANLNLQEGNNMIEITGTNSVGSDIKSCNIIYEKPVTPVPPVVTIITPGLDPYTTNSPSQVVVASVLNVQSANNITVTQNGVQISGFNYNASNNLVTINNPLQPGTNYFVVTGTNNDGSASDATTIIYNMPQQVLPPVVSFIDPYNNPLTVYNNQYHVTAQVLHVAGKNNISLKINGIPTSNFTYSNSSKNMDVYANLVAGSNVFEVTAVNNDGSDYASTTIIYKEPAPQLPPVVTITNPTANPYNVSVPQGTVIATVLNVNSQNNIVVKVNNVNTTNFNYNINTKVLQLSANLIQGNNTVSITGTNQYGSDNASTLIVYQPIHKPTPPVVNITFPVANPYTTTQPHQTVLASVQNIVSTNQLDVKINGISTGNYTFNPSNGEVAVNNIVLNQGNNLVSITGTNQDGTASDNTTIVYKPISTPCDKPTVNFTAPASTPLNLQAASNAYSFQLALTNTSSASQLEVKFNGVPVSNFNYSGNNLTVPVTLQVGSNVLEVTAENSCGQGHASAAVVYIEEQQPCDEPVVNLIQPTTTVITQGSTYGIVAQVLNVSGANEISLFVNGQASQNFTYDLATHTLTSTVNVPLDNNTILIKAINACGAQSASVNIKTESCDEPAVSITSPSNNSTTTAATATINASINNVSNASDISLLVNGSPSSFNYNNGNLTSTINLQVGVNNVQIKANNTCGQDVQTIEINRDNCNPPALSVVKPASNPYSTNADNIHVKAYATNAVQNDIGISLNGTQHSFQFEAGTGKIIFVNTLQEGSNVLVIKVSNACGTASKTININYQPDEQVVTLSPPDVTITTPSSAPHQASSPIYTVKGNVTNISSSNDMSVTVDGVNTNNFTYNPLNGNFNVPLTLANGATTSVVVFASNSAGSDNESTSVVYTLNMQGNLGGGGKGNPNDGTPVHGNAHDGTIDTTGTGDIVKPGGSTGDPGNNNGSGIAGNNGSGASGGSTGAGGNNGNGNNGNGGNGNNGNGAGNNGGGIAGNNGNGNGGNGNGNGNNGHGNNEDGVDSSNPGQGGGGPNGSNDPSGNIDDENGNNGGGTGTGGSNGSGGNTGNGNNGGGNTGTGGNSGTGGNNGSGNNGNGNAGAGGNTGTGGNTGNGNNGNGGNGNNGNGAGNNGGGIAGNNGNGNGGNGNGNGNNGHGNNEDGVDSSNPGQGGGGPNGSNDPSGNIDDENGNNGGGNTGTSGNGNNGSGANGGTSGNTVNPPVISMINPSSATENSMLPTYNVSGSVTHLSGSSDLSIDFNGSSVTSFSFDQGTGVFQFMASLNQGVNDIYIEANNSHGSDSETITISYTSGGVAGGNGNGNNGNGGNTGNGGNNGNGGNTGNGNNGGGNVSGNNNNGGNGNGNGTTNMQINNNVNGTGTDQLSESEKIDKQYKQLIDEGDKLLDKKDYNGAEKKYKSAGALVGAGDARYPTDRLNVITTKRKQIADKQKAEAERIRKEQAAKAEQERIRKEQAAKEKAEREAKAKAEAERLKKEQAAKAEQERIRKEQAAKDQAERDAKAKAEAEKRRKEEAAKAEQERLRQEQAAKAKAEQDAKAKAQAEQKRKEEAAKAEAERKRQEAQARAQAEEERKRKEAEARARAEREAKAKAEAERKRKEAEARAKAEQEARARAEAERKRKEAEARAKAEAEKKRKAAEAKAKADAAAKAKAEAEKKRKAEEAAKAKAEAEKKSSSRAAGGRQ